MLKHPIIAGCFFAVHGTARSQAGITPGLHPALRVRQPYNPAGSAATDNNIILAWDRIFGNNSMDFSGKI